MCRRIVVGSLTRIHLTFFLHNSVRKIIELEEMIDVLRAYATLSHLLSTLKKHLKKMLYILRCIFTIT